MAMQFSYSPSRKIIFEHAEKLNEIDYEKHARTLARQLGISVAQLDIELSQRRDRTADADGYEPGSPPPWAEPVNGNRLMRELLTVMRRHIVLDEKVEVAVALWILFAHTHDAFQVSPILLLTSPSKRCGKTRVVRLLKKLVPRPHAVSNATSAAIFHVIQRHNPTLMLDEVDSYTTVTNDFRGVLNSGHNRDAAFVSRATQDYSTWAPKVLAPIGALPDTLEDRSIKVELRRKPEQVKVADIPDGWAYLGLHRRCKRWAADNFEKLRYHKPVIPKSVDDRARDNWRPLLAIAELVGSRWPETARDACLEISRNRAADDEDALVLLLKDMRELFDRNDGENLSSTQLVKALGKMEHRPWPDYHNGSPITARDVAKIFKLVRIQSQQVQVRGRRPNGYKREWFERAWSEYLPPREQLTDERVRA
jgi:hypothetical protein